MNLEKVIFALFENGLENKTKLTNENAHGGQGLK
jgi:hypothetical protein